MISPGSECDLTGLKLIDNPLPAGGILDGDKAYTGYAWEEALLQARDFLLIAERTTNSKRPYLEEIEKQGSKVRKRVDTLISGIVRLMPSWIQAVTE